MLRRIVRHGCGRAITLPRILLEAIGVDPDGDVEITVQKGKLIVSAPRSVVTLIRDEDGDI